MERTKDTESTMADYLIRKLTDEKNGLENTIAFLRASFLSSAVDALFYARREAGLTQEQAAQKLGKKQEAIARWEADKEGRMSLRQYFDIAVACGRIPLNIVLEPVEAVRKFVIDHPEEPQTPELYSAWLKWESELTPVALVSPSDESTPAQEETLAAQSAEQGLEDVHEQDQKRTDYILLQEPKGSSQTAA